MKNKILMEKIVNNLYGVFCIIVFFISLIVFFQKEEINRLYEIDITLIPTFIFL